MKNLGTVVFPFLIGKVLTCMPIIKQYKEYGLFPFLIGKVLTDDSESVCREIASGFPFLIGKVLTLHLSRCDR